MKTKMLVYVDTKNNNNKYYKITLDGSRVEMEWGRVGGSSQRMVSNGGESEFNKKIKEKTKKGYVEVEIMEDSNKLTIEKDDRLVKSLLKEQDKEIENAIQRLIDLNTHDLFEGKLNIKVGLDGLVTTPIGVVTMKTLNKAQKYLTEMKRGDRTNYDNYLTLIPHVFDRSNMGDAIPDLDKEQKLLTKLKQSVSEYEERKSKAKDTKVDDSIFEDLFHVKISKVNNEELEEVNDFFKSGINTNHYGASRKKIKNVFKLEYNDEHNQRITTTAKTLGNTRLLWHGTSAKNVLNILRKGLFCPKSNDKNYHVTGRMFGDGVYLSDQSTKSLNYAIGNWGGQRTETAFMFLTETAMGKTYKPERRPLHQIPSYARQHGFDSIFVEGKRNGYVMNNEMIVWNVDQIRLKYLVEFE